MAHGHAILYAPDRIVRWETALETEDFPFSCRPPTRAHSKLALVSRAQAEPQHCWLCCGEAGSPPPPASGWFTLSRSQPRPVPGPARRGSTPTGLRARCWASEIGSARETGACPHGLCSCGGGGWSRQGDLS